MPEVNSPLGELHALQRAERLQRLRTAAFAVPLLLGVLLLLVYAFQLDALFFPRPRFLSEGEQREPLFAAIGVLMLAFSGLGALMLYLQTGFRRRTTPSEATPAIYASALNSIESYLNDLKAAHDKKSEEFEQKIQENQALLLALKEQQVIALSPEERTDFLSTLKAQLQTQTFSEVADGLKKAWMHDLDRASQVELVSRQLQDAKARLSTELEAVNRRGNLNLSIGIVTTLSGLFILGATVFDRYAGSAEPHAVLLHYIPRLSLVLFIEVFAYFFLKLYKASLAETKYFQNELTNVESKFTALVVALHRPQDFGAPAAIEALARTERNFLLKQGESTVELEGMKLESDRQKGLISELRGLLRRDEEKAK